VDVVLDANAMPQVKIGDRVRGGASIVALAAGTGELAMAGAMAETGVRS